jgi:hypothetical protein
MAETAAGDSFAYSGRVVLSFFPVGDWRRELEREVKRDGADR